jgi:mRNA interferase HicA
MSLRFQLQYWKDGEWFVGHLPHVHFAPASRLDTRAILPDTQPVKGAEFIRHVRKLGRRRDVVVNGIPERGKGSHGTLYYGARFTVVQNLNNELKKATLE